jgi:hypothetical protein
MSGNRNPGPEFCVAIARTLNESPIKVFRLAGLLPDRAQPGEDPRLRDVMHKFSLLDDEAKAEVERYLDYVLSTTQRETLEQT